MSIRKWKHKEVGEGGWKPLYKAKWVEKPIQWKRDGRENKWDPKKRREERKKKKRRRRRKKTHLVMGVCLMATKFLFHFLFLVPRP